jgi:serine/threonine-protein phosphatase 2B catalytic subunit
MFLDIVAPTAKIPTDDEFFSKKRPGLPDLDFLKQHFIREGVLAESQALHIITKGAEILRKETTVLDIEAPLTGIILPFTS